MSAMIRLIWKEYRALRGLWLALAIIGLACDAVIFILANSPQERLAGCFGFAGVLPVGFALGAGAMLFALEREEATYEFLRCLPATSPRVFTSKVLTALAGTLLLALLLLSVTFGDVRRVVFQTNRLTAIDNFLDHQNLARFADAFDVVLVYALLVVQGIGWSVFFSLRSARTLVAALLGALGAVTCISLVHYATEGIGIAKLHGTYDAPALHLLATLIVWSANIWLGSRWLYARKAKRQRRSEVERAHKRLLWQAWRGSYRLLTVILVLGVLVPVLLWPVFIPTSVLGFALLGSCTFLADQEGRQFRFFAEHGTSPRRLWLSRQIFWGGAALGLAAILFLAERLWAAWALAGTDAARFMLKATEWAFEPHNYAIWVALAFAAGQACSMFFQSGVLAAALGVVLAGVFAGWMAIMHKLEIGLWWSAAPLSMALAAATWLRSTGWLLERHTWRAWAPALLVPTATIATLLVSVPAYRVWEIPNPVTAVELALPPKPSAEAATAASRFERLCESLSGLAFTGLSPNYDALRPLRHSANAAPTAADLEWLKANEDSLRQAISAIDELPRDATIASGTPSLSPHLGFDVIGAMILRDGQLAEADGKLDEAWRSYRSVIKLGAFVRHENGVVGEVLGNNLVSAAAVQLIHWGACKGQTVANLRIAIDAVRQSEANQPPLAEVVVDDYRDYVKITDEIVAHPETADPRGAFLAKWAPWEIARLRRLYRYGASLNLLDARVADAELAGLHRFPARPGPDGYSAKASRYWQTTIIGPMFEVSALVRSRCSAVCYRRAAELALGAEAWRLEHGVLPEALAELKAAYFDELPLDPYTGNQFAWFPWGLSEPVRSQGGEKLAAGTPFLYSIGTEGTWFPEEKWLEDLRRKSADDRVKSSQPALESRATTSPEPNGTGPTPRIAAGSVPAGNLEARSIAKEPLRDLGGWIFPLVGER